MSRPNELTRRLDGCLVDKVVSVDDLEKLTTSVARTKIHLDCKWNQSSPLVESLIHIFRILRNDFSSIFWKTNKKTPAERLHLAK